MHPQHGRLHQALPIIDYENELVYRLASARRLRYATLCAIAPLVFLIGACGTVFVVGHPPLMLIAMLSLMPAHVVVALGVFLVCMEYGEARSRMIPIESFLRRFSVPIVLLILNGGAFVGVILLGLSLR